MDIYQALPPLLQDAAVSFRGFQLKHWRYTKETWDALDNYEHSQWWSINEIDAFIDSELVRIVHHAYETTPFYRSFYDEHGVRPGDLNGKSDLLNFPILEKDIFRQNLPACTSRIYKPSDMCIANTSGTTGKPLSVFHAQGDIMKRMALMERLYGWYDQSRWRRRASFTGKLIVPVDRLEERFYRKNWPINQWLFSSHHLMPANLGKYTWNTFTDIRHSPVSSQ